MSVPTYNEFTVDPFSHASFHIYDETYTRHDDAKMVLDDIFDTEFHSVFVHEHAIIDLESETNLCRFDVDSVFYLVTKSGKVIEFFPSEGSIEISCK